MIFKAAFELRLYESAPPVVKGLVIEHGDVMSAQETLPSLLTSGIYRRPAVCLQDLVHATRKSSAQRCASGEHISDLLWKPMREGGRQKIPPERD